MSFSDTIFLFFLALILFGPKKLPEMARQAGRLLAELRRASNEFRSQIETEIAHLEVEKKEVEKKAQTVLPLSAPPDETVASMSLNPSATEAAAHASSDTLAGSAAREAAPETATPVTESSTAPSTSDLAPATKPQTSQESHV